jgi:hypothetical protein
MKYLLLLLMAFPVMATEATVVAFSAFNGTKATLFAEKGECAQGALAVVDMGKGNVQACWYEKDGYVVIDLNTYILAFPKSAFMVIQKKTFS